MANSTRLGQALAYATMPAQDIDRDRRFYSQTLGLDPVEDTAQGLTYELGRGSRLLVFPSSGKPSGDHTQVAFSADDVEAAVEELRSRGVRFEEYDLPGLKTVNGIADMGGRRSAWFHDSEGNLLGLTQPS
ncbi:VOC family protein [Sinomonas sp. ASV322]|uniref:VOC family protein n=1 Tax=Sinomonas sp. ASV322 TaxID=3041920 RepID=UPI0027DC37DA|nr:VOC family protein [Sinomonas sp. ASV322]MDQ4504066.1 VOC family protein [Sinomonas sp. ASV322]